mgnify:CR=1 FL=1
MSFETDRPRRGHHTVERCTVEGCKEWQEVRSNKHGRRIGRGLCHAHALADKRQRVRKSQWPEWVETVGVVTPTLAPAKPAFPCPVCGAPATWEACSGCGALHRKSGCEHPPPIVKTCSSPDCWRRAESKGLCNHHAAAVRRGGKDEAGVAARGSRMTVVLRTFSANVLWILAHRANTTPEKMAADILDSYASLHRPGGDPTR